MKREKGGNEKRKSRKIKRQRKDGGRWKEKDNL